MAIFKRAVVLLATKLDVHARIPNGEEVEVPFIRFGQKKDFLEDGANDVYHAYKNGLMSIPCGWFDGPQWGQALLTMTLTTCEKQPRTKVIVGESAADPTTHVHTEIEPSTVDDGNHLVLTDINKFVLVQTVTRCLCLASGDKGNAVSALSTEAARERLCVNLDAVGLGVCKYICLKPFLSGLKGLQSRVLHGAFEGFRSAPHGHYSNR